VLSSSGPVGKLKVAFAAWHPEHHIDLCGIRCTGRPRDVCQSLDPRGAKAKSPLVMESIAGRYRRLPRWTAHHCRVSPKPWVPENFSIDKVADLGPQRASTQSASRRPLKLRDADHRLVRERFIILSIAPILLATHTLIWRGNRIGSPAKIARSVDAKVVVQTL
jgi:hypothetical protein